MEQVIAQFTYLPATKSEREMFVQMCVDEITSGVRDPLEFEIMLKNLEETISAIRKRPEVKDLCLDFADRFPEKTFAYKGVTITKSQKTTYDYSQCGHAKYNDLIAQKAKLSEEIKEIETFLKAIKPGMQVPDQDTGEILTGPSTSVTSFLMIKLP
jgi:hypothetical protein